MGMRIYQAGNPGLDPAAGSTRQVGVSSKPAMSQLATASSQAPTLADAFFEVDAAELENALGGINSYLVEAGVTLSFTYDEASGRSAVRVMDADGNVIRQLPPQELLDVYAKIRNIVGILLDENG